ncbi:retrovirus-related Pol polyprotein from transposon 17.6 [Trichonephila clavipes]|uniref:Retrovirus-related Pol polyprotein from transposon 17.6 n=1 Tax=Trichonephila clavipes TaxID=2585209 RepID=A0A8X7BIZ0_TRICX|nr:retrovirus-related Pol polyprotein from transposon 17.6 [Trichonephila clavipes]
MALSDSLNQINLGVQSETQGGLHSGAQRINPEFKDGSNFRIIPEQYFSGMENVAEFLENIDNNLTYYEIPTQLACAYLKGHLTGRAIDWVEVLGYRVVEDKATDYAQLKQALTEQFPLDTQNIKTRNDGGKLPDHVISRLEPQILDYVEKDQGFSIREFRDTNQSENNRFPNRNRQENWRETRGNNRYSDNSRPRREFSRFEGQGVVDNRRFDGRHRGGQSDNIFHNQGGRQDGSRNSAFKDQAGLSHVLYHEIDTGDQGPVVSRPYRYDRVKQGITDYHIEKMLQVGKIRPIKSPYASPGVLTRKNNGLPPYSPETYRFTIDYRKLNAITKYPRYPLLKKGAKFNWSKEAQDAFNKVKRALTEAPVLQLPNFQEQFNLVTDARGVGIGAVLNKNHKPIAFVSRTLNKAEINYTVTERECFVVIWALNKFKTYFGSLPVKVITDHATLTKLTNGRNLSSWMIRWTLKLSEFNIEWEHRAGVQNVVVDLLSRNPVGNMEG